MTQFDKLNELKEDEVLDISEYFDEMELPKEEKENRKEFAESVEEVMLFIFALFSVMNRYGNLRKQFIVGQILLKYSEIVQKYMEIDKQIEKYIQKFSEEIVDTTIKYQDEEYYLSEERATLVGVNEANSILGHRQLQEAKEKGYTRKMWITERDIKVRGSHREVDGLEIPIDDYFPVGNSVMQYPHDMSAPPEQTVNCRCTLRFS